MRLLTILICVLVVTIPARAATIRVPADQPTIQAGLDGAIPGDTVLVAPGVYMGDGNRALTFRGEDLVLRSESGASMTVMECQGWQGVIFQEGESKDAVVDGFTVAHSWAGWPGGAFSFTRSSATIKNCIIENSGTTGTFEGHPEFFDCIFRNNISSTHGGGVTVDWSSSMLLEGCTFLRNSNHTAWDGGAIYVAPGSEVTIRNCLIVGNTSTDKGGGVYVGGRALIVGTTISDNCSYGDGGAIYVAGNATIERSILSFNTNYSPDCGSGVVIASCTDMFGNEGGDWMGCLAGQAGVNGNVALDPLYCERRPSSCYGFILGKYELESRSPCAPDHSGGCGLIGALPVACGATAIESGTWGQVKARSWSR